MEQIGNYKILRKIGSGGMAEVYLAEPVGRGGDRVVVKVLKEEHLGRDDIRAMFMEEARLAGRIRHPNVVTVLDSGMDLGRPLLVLQYVEGYSLYELLVAASRRGETIPLEIGLHILWETTLGLHAAHTATDATGAPLNLIHRDVCPQNILVGVDGVARITDFGIAHPQDATGDARPGQLTGRAGYLSPEQCEGLALDRRSDIFSLGTVLYEVTVGRRLFKGSSRIETQLMIKEARVPRPTDLVPGFPEALEEIILKALAKDPTERYRDADALAWDLARFMGDLPEEVDRAKVGTFVRSLMPPAPAEVEQPAAGASTQATPEVEALPEDDEGPTPVPATSTTGPAKPDVGEEEPPAPAQRSDAPGSQEPVGAGPDQNTQERGGESIAVESIRPSLETTKPSPLKPPPPDEEDEEPPPIPVVQRPPEPLPEQAPVAATHAIPDLEPESPDDIFYALDVAPGKMRSRGMAIGAVVAVLGLGLYVAYFIQQRSSEQEEYWAPSPPPQEAPKEVGPPPFPEPDATLVLPALPPGTRCYLDLRPEPFVPPVRLQVVSGRSHTVVCQNPTHYPVVTRVRVPSPGAVVSPEISMKELEQEVPRGVVFAESKPDGARILSSGVEIGRAPTKLTNLLAWEEQVLQFRLEGHTTSTHLLTPQAGALEMAVLADMSPAELDRDKYDLKVDSIPADTLVYIDGKLAGATPFFGRYWRGTILTLRLEKEGFEPYERDVALDGGAVHVHAYLRPKVTPMGTLVLKSNLPAKVYVGTEEIGEAPVKISLPAGTHEVVVDAEKAGRRAYFKIVLEPAEVLERKVVFGPEDGFNVE